MTDEELIRSAGGDDYAEGWNPLDSSAHALDLAVRLGIEVWPLIDAQVTTAMPLGLNTAQLVVREKHNGDPYAATRRAITRAAARLLREKGNGRDRN